ncbi:hypothetical protein [Mesorhizobium sp. URHB0026]
MQPLSADAMTAVANSRKTRFTSSPPLRHLPMEHMSRPNVQTGARIFVKIHSEKRRGLSTWFLADDIIKSRKPLALSQPSNVLATVKHWSRVK